MLVHTARLARTSRPGALVTLHGWRNARGPTSAPMARYSPRMAIDWIRAFPAALASHVMIATKHLPPATLEHDWLVNRSYTHQWPAVIVAGEPVQIPYRIYNKPLQAGAWHESEEVFVTPFIIQVRNAHAATGQNITDARTR